MFVSLGTRFDTKELYRPLFLKSGHTFNFYQIKLVINAKKHNELCHEPAFSARHISKGKVNLKERGKR